MTHTPHRCAVTALEGHAKFEHCTKTGILSRLCQGTRGHLLTTSTSTLSKLYRDTSLHPEEAHLQSPTHAGGDSSTHPARAHCLNYTHLNWQKYELTTSTGTLEDMSSRPVQAYSKTCAHDQHMQTCTARRGHVRILSHTQRKHAATAMQGHARK